MMMLGVVVLCVGVLSGLLGGGNGESDSNGHTGIYLLNVDLGVSQDDALDAKIEWLYTHKRQLLYSSSRRQLKWISLSSSTDGIEELLDDEESNMDVDSPSLTFQILAMIERVGLTGKVTSPLCHLRLRPSGSSQQMESLTTQFRKPSEEIMGRVNGNSDGLTSTAVLTLAVTQTGHPLSTAIEWVADLSEGQDKGEEQRRDTGRDLMTLVVGPKPSQPVIRNPTGGVVGDLYDNRETGVGGDAANKKQKPPKPFWQRILLSWQVVPVIILAMQFYNNITAQPEEPEGAEPERQQGEQCQGIGTRMPTAQPKHTKEGNKPASKKDR